MISYHCFGVLLLTDAVSPSLIRTSLLSNKHQDHEHKRAFVCHVLVVFYFAMINDFRFENVSSSQQHSNFN